MEKKNPHYENVNLNPKGNKCGDCTIRCMAAALDITWDDAYDMLAFKGKAKSLPMDDINLFREILAEHGFMEVTVKPKKGEKRPNLRWIASLHQDSIVVGQCSHHVMCAKDGRVMDIWDSSERALYRYWIRQTDAGVGENADYDETVKTACGQVGVGVDVYDKKYYTVSVDTKDFGKYEYKIGKGASAVPNLEMLLESIDRDEEAIEAYKHFNDNGLSLAETIYETDTVFWKLKQLLKLLKGKG